MVHFWDICQTPQATTTSLLQSSCSNHTSLSFAYTSFLHFLFFSLFPSLYIFLLFYLYCSSQLLKARMMPLGLSFPQLSTTPYMKYTQYFTSKLPITGTRKPYIRATLLCMFTFQHKKGRGFSFNEKCWGLNVKFQKSGW